MNPGGAPRPESVGGEDEHRPITMRLPNETLATLQFVSAAIRRTSGAALGSSAIVRALITRLAEMDIDTRGIRSIDDVRRVLSRGFMPLPGRREESRARD